MDLAFARLDAGVIALALAGLMLGGWTFGRFIGQRARVAGEGDRPGDKFDDASIMLLSLLLAFAFGTSIGKHDQRRLAVVADSNAIGDFYTCTIFVREPTRTELRTLIRQYVDLRLNAALRSRTDRSYDLEKDIVRSEQMQGSMTELVSRAVQEGVAIPIPLVNTLNSMISNQASRLAAIRDRLPASIVILLLAAAVVSIFLVGREQGRATDSQALGTLCFIILVCFAVYVTLDLNQPERGLIQISQEPLERLLASMPK